ncbi:TrmH family RNA methyltransferase [Virgibacillus sp. W0430]|uniref:TrmH family RNA methyltransferase n=1 Tax=Virgibacillus sp. W0430 TaxID=3391580 RepID=UPI003F489A19
MISSLQNEHIKKWRKLRSKKERIKTQSFLIEGFHLIEEAKRSTWKITHIIVQDGVSYPSWCEDYPVTVCTKEVFHHLSLTEAPQGIAAVVKIKQANRIRGNYVLLLDEVQDPGNFGTMIRTADAAGFSAVIAGHGTVDMYNDKVVRATQGSLFHLPVFHARLDEQIKCLKQEGFTIWGAALTGAVNYSEAEKDNKVAIVVGNEGAGIQKNILALVDKTVKIPIYGQAESLNVSVAASILMYYFRS